MRRRTVHLAFAVAALGFGALAGYEASRLYETVRVNRAIAVAASGTYAGDVPQARLAQANTLSRTGRQDAALAVYNGLIVRDRTDAAGQAALFNLGNMLLRASRALEASDAFQAQAMVELAKQRYRELLRVNPEDWDARYNLERALWMAPEAQEMFGAETDVPKLVQRIRVPGLPPGDLP